MDDLSVYARSLDKAKYYVYCLYDTEDKMKRPFYIGKGKSTRCLDHIKYPDDSPKSMRIKELLANKKLGIYFVMVWMKPQPNLLRRHASTLWGSESLRIRYEEVVP